VIFKGSNNDWAMIQAIENTRKTSQNRSKGKTSFFNDYLRPWVVCGISRAGNYSRTGLSKSKKWRGNGRENTKLKTFPRGPCGVGTFPSVFILILAKNQWWTVYRHLVGTVYNDYPTNRNFGQPPLMMNLTVNERWLFLTTNLSKTGGLCNKLQS